MKNNNSCYSNVTHKLLTRITAISGYAQGLEYGITAPEKAGSMIQKECEALTEEIDKLNSAAQLDYQQTPAEPEPVPLIEVLENCIDRFSEAGARKRISLKLTKSMDEVRVLGNEDYLEDILDNLLSNAIRYAKSEILISVSSQGERILLTVADDGDGIREEDLPHIFDRFYKGPGGNFGLGLAIAREAAEQMNGTLTAANRPEGGAVFTLDLELFHS